MQFVGVFALVFGYGGIYTAVQMLKRPAGGTSGSVLYWITGIDSLGAPSGGGSQRGSGKGGASTPSVLPSNQTTNPRQRTGRGTHSL